jgi:hypothetical protein
LAGAEVDFWLGGGWILADSGSIFSRLRLVFSRLRLWILARAAAF